MMAKKKRKAIRKVARKRKPIRKVARKRKAIRKVKRRSRSTGSTAITVHDDTGSLHGRKRRKSRKRKAARVIVFGNPCAQSSTMGGAQMPKKKAAKRVMPWFRKGTKKRRRRSYLGGAGGAGGKKLIDVAKNGAITVGGAALGSVLAARVPLPASMAKFRGLVPVVAGVLLGGSKFGRAGMGSYLSLGMIVAGGLAVGRQYAPQVFAGEDEMLGLPELDEPLGIVYAGEEGDEEQFGDDDEMEGEDVLGAVFQNGEEAEDVELFGEFVTSADM